MKTTILALFLLSACAAWTPTREGVIRSREADRLWSCLSIERLDPHYCVQQSRDRCRAQQMELDCGLDDLWTR